MDVHQIRTELYRAIGWTYQSPGQMPDIVQDMRKWRMIDCRSGRFEFPGSLSGIGGNGQGFRIAEVSDIPSFGDQTGFQGVIVSFKQERAFKGRTIIAVDKGVYNPTTIDLMPRIPLACDDFEKMFEVYSDQPDLAQSIFTSGFLKKMTVFSQETLGKRLQASLLGDEIHFVLENQEKFSFARPPQGAGNIYIKNLIVEAASICVILEKLYCIQASIGRVDSREDKQIRLDYYKKCLSKMMQIAKTISTETQKGQAA